MDKVNIEGLGRTKDDIIINSIQPLFTAGDFMEVNHLLLLVLPLPPPLSSFLPSIFDFSDREQVLKQAHEIRERLVSLGCFNNVNIYIDTSSGKASSPDGLEVFQYFCHLLSVYSCVVSNINQGSFFTMQYFYYYSNRLHFMSMK